MCNKIIVALDVESKEKAGQWVEKISGHVGLFKVGKQLFTAAGPDVVTLIKEAGGGVFLDLKFHDIPNTVAAASVQALRLGVDMLNVHALGGYEMMAKTADEVNKEAHSSGREKPILIAVTILTSMNDKGLEEAGIMTPVADEVVKLASLAKRAGLDGVVASPQEIKIIKETCGEDFVVVTPGVRPSFASMDDQKRVMTPLEAVRAGADYLVIGRPVTKAEDPLRAISLIEEELCQG
ncbi:MAG: orotidine-5'-phosphate decarboxylase [Deltaproteobacteria bacterium]|nr:orotidine-5'-phosphate decarboxylase [Deltaproteobacteria bacterium]